VSSFVETKNYSPRTTPSPEILAQTDWLPVNSSHTQSTRHKRAHNKTTSTSPNYLHAVRRHPG